MGGRAAYICRWQPSPAAQQASRGEGEGCEVHLLKGSTTMLLKQRGERAGRGDLVMGGEDRQGCGEREKEGTTLVM